MIEIKNLYLKFIREYYALYDVNMIINDGEVVAFVGKEHSGKTTLLRVIAGLEKFDKGEVYINNRELETVDFSIDVNLGYVPQNPVFLENKSVYENLRYVLLQRKATKNDIEEKINKALIDFNIEKYRNIKIKDLDLYEKYLISFVRLTLRKLDYLLVDNIFEKLSTDEAGAFVQLIKDLFINKKTTTILVGNTCEQFKDVCDKCFEFDYGSVKEMVKD